MLFPWFLISLFAVTFGCHPMPSTSQGDYCYADIVMEIEVIKEINGMPETAAQYEYNVTVSQIYKGKEKLGNTKVDTIFGLGPMHSCGPQVLDNGGKYLIYAKVRDGKIMMTVLGGYVDMKNFTEADMDRMTTLYDCSCTIKLKGYWQEEELPPPTKDECHMPKGGCYGNVFCKRDEQSGRCQVGIQGTC